MPRLEIYTDGSCLGNPGRGGWGVVCEWEEKLFKFGGADLDTTNNRMELLAVVQALTLVRGSRELLIYTDSKYVIDGYTKWLPNWKKNGWKTSTKKPVKNKDLWEQLDTSMKLHKSVDFQWVKGHNGDRLNEMVDDLARSFAEGGLTISKAWVDEL